MARIDALAAPSLISPRGRLPGCDVTQGGGADAAPGPPSHFRIRNLVTKQTVAPRVAFARKLVQDY